METIDKQKSAFLLNKFISAIDIQKTNSKKLFTIGLIGLNGSGKSFVARKISERLGLYIASNDNIRRFLNENGFDGASPMQNFVFNAGPIISKYLYDHKISHIIDADLLQHHQITKENALKNGAKLYLINIICPERIILKRLQERELETRKNPETNFSRVGVDEYFKRKALHATLSLPDVFFTFDTSKDIEPQLNDLIGKFEKEQFI